MIAPARVGGGRRENYIYIVDETPSMIIYNRECPTSRRLSEKWDSTELSCLPRRQPLPALHLSTELSSAPPVPDVAAACAAASDRT